MLSWPGWLTCSRYFMHNSGHPSAASQMWDRESSPAKDQSSTTVQWKQPALYMLVVGDCSMLLYRII